MFDLASLQASYIMLMCLVLVLSYGITYRTNRTSYAGWWCLSVALCLGGAMSYMLIGTAHQVWANPLGNMLYIAGVGCVWAASRTLRGRTLPWWCIAAGALLVGVTAAFDDPGTKLWPAGGWFLAATWILLSLAAREQWLVARPLGWEGPAEGLGHRRSLWALFGCCAVVAALYAVRWVAYLLVGPDAPPFTTYLGSELATFALTGLAVAIAFTMSTLSEEQQKQALRDLAAHDGLTGLLNRGGFLRLAEQEIASDPDAGGQIIIADLDHFKKINDELGHSAGDLAIMTFAEVCRSLVRETDLVGRYGGEEFILLLPRANRERADAVVENISGAMAKRALVGTTMLPTISYGIAPAALPLLGAIERADQALYRAKAAGRDRAVHHADA